MAPKSLGLRIHTFFFGDTRALVHVFNRRVDPTEDADLWQEGAAQQSVAHSLHDRRPSTLVGSGLIGVHALAESAQQRVVGAHHLGVEPVHELSADLAVGRIVDSVRRLAGVGFQIEKFVCI